MEIPSGSTLRSLGASWVREVHPAILHAMTLLIPVNIYVIGNWLGAGVQWPLFRYQETFLGRNVISIPTDLWYVTEGIFHGRTAISTVVWIPGAILLLVALLIALSGCRERLQSARGYLLIAGTLLFLLSTILQYGFSFHGPAGFAIPIGIPFLLALGLILVRVRTEESPLVKGERLSSRLYFQVLLLFLLCFLIYNTTTYLRMSGDTTPAQLVPMSILRYGTLSLDQFSSSFNTPDNIYAFIQVGGHYYSYFPIVTPVLLTPLYVVPYLLITAFQVPLAYPVIAPLARCVSAAVAAGGVVLVYLNARALFSRTPALLTAITYALGTSTWAISSQALWQQGMIELLLAAMIFLIIRRETGVEGSHLVPLGILSGLLVMARPPDALLVLPVIWYVARYYTRQVHHYLVPAVLSMLPFILYNIVIFGSFFGGYTNNLGIFRAGPEVIIRFAGFLLAPNIGFFIFSPVLILGLLGYFLAGDIPNPRIRELFVLYGPALILLVLLYSFYVAWTGAAFGPRFLTGLLPVYIMYLGLFLDRAFRLPETPARTGVLGLFAVLLLVSMGIQFIGAFYYPYIRDVTMDDRRVWDTGDLLILRSFRDGSELMSTVRVNTVPPLPPLLTLDLPSGRVMPFVGESSPEAQLLLPGWNSTPSGG